MKKTHKQKFLFISILLLMIFNIPMVLMFNQKVAILGIPIFYFSIFSIWSFVIIWSYIILKKYYE